MAGTSFIPDPNWPTITDLANRAWGDPKQVLHGGNELRWGNHGSKSLLVRENVWYDNEETDPDKKGGGYVAMWNKAFPGQPLPPRTNGHDTQRTYAAPRPSAPAQPAAQTGVKPWEDVGTIYPYLDADGALVLQVIRTLSGKPRFRQRAPKGVDGKGRDLWWWKVQHVPNHNRLLYRLPELLRSGDQTVWITEGEKDCDNLAKLGLVATTNIGGAGKWRDEYARFFARKNIVVLPDNDGQSVDEKTGELKFHANGAPILVGQDHAAQVAASLHGVAGTIKVLALPGLALKGDVSDWLQGGGTVEDLERLAREAPFYVPPPEPEPEPEEDGPDGPGEEWMDRPLYGPPEPPPPNGDGPGGPTGPRLPDLFVMKSDLPIVSQELRDHLADHPWLFERGSPARLVVYPADASRQPEVDILGNEGVIHAAHDVCRPFAVSAKGERKNVTLPDSVAALYLALTGRWNLRQLKGICGSVLLDDDGTIHAVEGYHEPTGMWCSRPPTLDVPDRPFKDQAVDALRRLRIAQRTFTFRGSPLTRVDGIDADVVDVDKPAALCESAALCGILTAVCRASLPLAPGVMVNAPAISGSGAGKGLWARMAAAIAYGIEAKAITAGHDEQELEKRIGASLLRGEPVLLLDNLNNTQLRSAQLESCLTEATISIRQFGSLKMEDVYCNAFVVVTGNGLQASIDSTRRFIYPTIEPPLDNPSERQYPPGFLKGILARRPELLSDCLTIWRWGRQQANLKRGLPVGSYEQWAAWVRDPLLALGCSDPIQGAQEARAHDPARVNLTALFYEWTNQHRDAWVRADDLMWQVKRLIDDRERTAAIRQKLAPMVNTRMGGFMLESKITGNKANQVTEYRVVVLPDAA